ncbi:hypothetical protein ACVWWN_000975 [Mycobacterium sp. URHB0021]
MSARARFAYYAFERDDAMDGITVAAYRPGSNGPRTLT